jgi:hypothetical protein
MIAPVMYSLTGLATTAIIWATRLLVAYRWRRRLFCAEADVVGGRGHSRPGASGGMLKPGSTVGCSGVV